MIEIKLTPQEVAIVLDCLSQQPLRTTYELFTRILKADSEWRERQQKATEELKKMSEKVENEPISDIPPADSAS